MTTTQLESTTIVTMMTAAEARAAVATINKHLEGARTLLLELYERAGWRALGYDSWRSCVMAEFQQSQAICIGNWKTRASHASFAKFGKTAS